METYLRIRNNLFLVWGGDAPNPFIPLRSIPLCRPSRPGKTKSRQRFAVGIPFYWVQLETFLYLEKVQLETVLVCAAGNLSAD